MQTYIALLRGINVSGQKKIKMADLKIILEELKYEKVQTYIQSGNVIFNSKSNDVKKLAKLISNKIKTQYNFDVEIIVKTPEEFKFVLDNNPFIKQKKDKERNYITFLFSEPEKEYLEKLKEISFPPEEFFLLNKIIFFYSPNNYGNAKMNNNFFEKKLNVIATTRNWQTVNKLFELSQNK
ncbi:MAG: DUF1697 domain-containing protein [Ignavibacteriae bacterium]|nr:DUF1697 domain-containing protein [Ignavibacteriota bacterium]